MFDKHEHLKQMRKHAKNFSSAMRPKKNVNQKQINHALALIDLFSKQSNFGHSKKKSIKVPTFLKILVTEDNFNFANEKLDKNNHFGVPLKKNNKEKNKLKLAEKKLLKLLSTKTC